MARQLVAPRLLAVSNPTISPGIVNTSAEQTLVSLTVPSASVAAGSVLEFEAAWDALNNSGAAVTYTFRLKLGATTVFTFPSVSHAANAQRYEAHLRAVVNIASLTDQRWKLEHFGAAAAVSNMGFLSTAFATNGVGTSAENLTTDKSLVLTVQMGTANANADCRLVLANLALNR